MRKEVLVALLSCTLLALTLALIFIHPSILGFAVYPQDTSFCAAPPVTDASNSFNNDNDCSIGGDGAIIATAGAVLDCQGFSLIGDSSNPSTFGIKLRKQSYLLSYAIMGFISRTHLFFKTKHARLEILEAGLKLKPS